MLKITVITVCYNEKEQMRKTIESVCQQTYPNIEYIVIDGASTDGTANLLQEYGEYPCISIYSERDFGIYNAMNRGIARASGDYVCFMNAGDTFYNTQVLSDVAGEIGKDRTTIYYGKTCMVYPDGLRQIQDFTESSANLKELLFQGVMPCHQSIFSPRKALTNHYFREQYRIRADFEWLLYSITHGCLCKAIPLIISCYDISGVSGRIKNMALTQKEDQKIMKEYQQDFMDAEAKACKVMFVDREIETLKYALLFYLMNHWMMLKQKNYSIGDYLRKKGYHQIAIYGMSHMGLNLLEELKTQDIQVIYGIDRNSDNLCTDIKTISPDETLEKVDAIIVTCIDHFAEIEERLSKDVGCPILSLEDIIYEIQKMTS